MDEARDTLSATSSSISLPVEAIEDCREDSVATLARERGGAKLPVRTSLEGDGKALLMRGVLPPGTAECRAEGGKGGGTDHNGAADATRLLGANGGPCRRLVALDAMLGEEGGGSR